MPVFAALLSIIPRNLPHAIKFLHPYIESLTCPPRHTVVYTATNNNGFLAAFNKYVFSSSKAGHHYRALLSFWASVATEAIAGMLDQSRSSRPIIQKQKEEDVLLRVLPFLNDGLAMRNVSELRIGCYMIITVLVSKVNLQDKVIVAIMEAVVSYWTPDTTHAGLICLAVLAQRRRSVELPKIVFKAVVSLQDICDDLLTLATKYEVSKLTLSLILGVVTQAHERRNAHQLVLARRAIEGQLLNNTQLRVAIEAVLSAVDDENTLNNPPSIQSELSDLVLRLADSEIVGTVFRDMIKESHIDMESLEMKLQGILPPEKIVSPRVTDDVEMEDAQMDAKANMFDSVASQIPTRTAYEISFLSHSESYIFGSLYRAFLSASYSQNDLLKFSDLPVLRKSLAPTEPLFVSFFIRIWCGPYPATLRAAALSSVRDLLDQTAITTDMQFLFPYILYALGDNSAKVRSAAVNLVSSLAPFYTKRVSDITKQDDVEVLGKDNIYGQNKRTKHVSWLSLKDAITFIEDVLLPNMEECRLDDSHTSQLIAEALNGSSHVRRSGKSRKSLTKSTKVAILTSFGSHIVHTPLFSVKLRLFSMLDAVGKVGSTSKTKVLLPLLVAHEHDDDGVLKETCEKERLSQPLLMAQLVKIVTPTDKEGVRVLQRIISSNNSTPPTLLRKAVFHRIREMWNRIKPDMQLSLAQVLMNIAVTASNKPLFPETQTDAIDTLRTIQLSVDILSSFLRNLPTLLTSMPTEPTTTKRRRTTQGHVSSDSDSTVNQVVLALRQATVVLELIESSKDGTDPGLSDGLFQVLGDIQTSKNHVDIEMGYLQSLVLSCLQRSVDGLKVKYGFLHYRSILIFFRILVPFRLNSPYQEPI